MISLPRPTNQIQMRIKTEKGIYMQTVKVRKTSENQTKLVQYKLQIALHNAIQYYATTSMIRLEPISHM